MMTALMDLVNGASEGEGCSNNGGGRAEVHSDSGGDGGGCACKNVRSDDGPSSP